MEKNTNSNEKDNVVNKNTGNEQAAFPVHNPFDPSDKKETTQEDIENEQKYKEALTERD